MFGLEQIKRILILKYVKMTAFVKNGTKDNQVRIIIDWIKNI